MSRSLTTTRPPHTVDFAFGGLDESITNLERAHAVILPVPYDGTVSYMSGARLGPRAIITASQSMELYDEELGAFYEHGIHTLPDLEVVADPKAMVDRVAEAVAWGLDLDKCVITLGGEHSITSGPVRAYAKKYKNLSVLQFDAHGDLRNEFHGTPWSHACVMRRVREMVPAVQVGIRSISEEEAEVIAEKKWPVFSARKTRSLRGDYSAIADALTDEVYITVDLDCFDPATVPGVGTPEPGGLDWYELTEIVAQVARRRKIVGFDIMELMPLGGQVRSDFLAARLTYRLWGWTLVSQGRLAPPDVNRPL
ncbi:MAG: agmatinase [Candidatus Eiseniibacteriota bacterium]